jgi:hypothetical protein
MNSEAINFKGMMILKKCLVLIILILLVFTSCSGGNNSQAKINDMPAKNILPVLSKNDLLNKSGSIVSERIRVPEGFERVSTVDNTFEKYLRDLPLKPDGAKVKLYNGETKSNDVFSAVIDIDIGDKDLQQCADAVIRLRAEYLFKNKMYDKIHFNFTNGFRADYRKWMNGYRIAINGDRASWIKKAGYSKDYSSFRKYLDIVFSYAGTLSLSREMKSIPLEELQIGDIFIKGGAPGHTVLVTDMARNKSTGEIIFLIAQSYMPAQEIHILKNLNNEGMSPWYSVNFGETLSTPEWEFNKGQLMRFIE